jgi:hypothetical protein
MLWMRIGGQFLKFSVLYDCESISISENENGDNLLEYYFQEVSTWNMNILKESNWLSHTPPVHAHVSCFERLSKGP